MDYFLEINNVTVYKNTMFIIMSGRIFGANKYSKPKIILHFENETEDRYIPMVLQSIEHNGDTCCFSGFYKYKLEKIFWEKAEKDYSGTLSFDLLYGNELIENVKYLSSDYSLICDSVRFDIKHNKNRYLIVQTINEKNTNKVELIKKVIKSLMGRNSVEVDDFSFSKKGEKANISWNSTFFGKLNNGLKRGFIIFFVSTLSRKPVKNNQIAFISRRSEHLQDNQLFIYNKLKEKSDMSFVLNLSTETFRSASIIDLFRFSKIVASSKIIIIDEYVPEMYFLNLRKETFFIQVWHACGAFKTVGFSRLGKIDAPTQSRKAHRNYDYSIVSSTNVRRWYAEAFGLSLKKVLPLGVPRTDVFFDDDYKYNIRKQIFEDYPLLEGKKIILFVPTFHGGIQSEAWYDFEKFDVKKIMDEIGKDYIIMIKHHPFIQKKHPIPEEYKENVIDMSDFSSVNDLLFVTDILITDYSSVVFEASLLDIPMLFYAYDLDEYIRDRDFYYDYRSFVPGKIVRTENELINSIKEEDFEHDKVEPFADKFFDIRDGKATDRVVSLIENIISDNSSSK